MRRLLAVALLVLFCTAYTVAQDYPKAEVFGGFSFTHLDTEGFTAPTGVSIKHWYPGWEAAVQYNLTKLLGIKADIGGNYGKPVSATGVTGIPSAHSYNFLFGPVISARTGRFTPFAQALFGANRLSLGSSTISIPPDLCPLCGVVSTSGYSETAFAMAFGGGLDVKISHHFAYRLGQFDYLFTKHCLAVAGVCTLGVDGAPAAHQNNFSFSTGIVIH